MNGIVLSLFDHSGNIARPWARAGYECVCVDTKHDGETVEQAGQGRIRYVEADITEYLPPRAEYRMVFAFPPCTNLAVSGARWFEEKGLDGLAAGVELVERARNIVQWADAPWMIENPVSTLSTYWREPDHRFHPYEYDGYTDRDEAYSKQTWLWTSDDFVMPETDATEEYDDRIHQMAPSDDRGEKRAETPRGFSRAVFEANSTADVPGEAHGGTSDTHHVSQEAHTSTNRGEKKGLHPREEIWAAVLKELRGGSRSIRVSDLDYSASRSTANRALKNMAAIGILRREDDGRVWYPGPDVSDYIGRSVPLPTEDTAITHE